MQDKEKVRKLNPDRVICMIPTHLFEKKRYSCMAIFEKLDQQSLYASGYVTRQISVCAIGHYDNDRQMQKKS